VSAPLLVLDGDSLAHRAYHALPKSINNNAVVGFTNFALRLWEQEEPRAVFVGWDTLTAPTYRHEELEVYQSGREFDDSLLRQFADGKAAGYEADDFLAAAVRSEEKRRAGRSVVVTSDRDSFQLVSDKTTVVTPIRGVSELARIGPDEVRERYGVEPEQVPDFIALRGDPSDRIPGAKGVGPKTAATILKQYGSLEAALDAGRFPQQREELLLYRRIATLDASAPLPPLKDQTPTWAEASSLFRSWGMNQMADRLAARAAGPA
jgi:DNA polymerase-1